MQTKPTSESRAITAGVLCYLCWGFVPLIFQQMGRVGADAWEIMGHRAAWGLLWSALLVLAFRHGGEVARALRNPRLLGLLALSSLLIAVNWTVYVIAVNSGHTLEASLGYYLNPLLNMAAGVWLFRERLDRYGIAAIALAGIGVAVQAAALGRLPWISLLLAVSFAGYGIIRKRVSVDAQAGLFLECLFLAGPGIGWLLYIGSQGQGHFLTSPEASFWLAIAGPVTVIPLALFAWAARRIPLSTMGFLQFLAPTIVFVIGVAQGEPFSVTRGISFALIWGGAAVFVIGMVLRTRRRDAVIAPEPGLIEEAR